MKYLILILIVIFPFNAFALDEELYAVDQPDGSVTYYHYFLNSRDSLEESLRGAGLQGLPFRRIFLSDIPQDSSGKKIDRKYWKRSGSKILVDSTKKQDDLDAQSEKEIEKEAVLSKLKITKKEAEVLKDVISGK